MPATESRGNKDELLRDVQRLRKELKIWERQFEKQNGRKAEKDDIVKDTELSQKYRLYSKLKVKLAKFGIQDAQGSGQSLDAKLQSKDDLFGSEPSLNPEQKKDTSPKPAVASNQAQNQLSIDGSRFKSILPSDQPTSAATTVLSVTETSDADAPGSPAEIEFDEPASPVLAKTQLAFQTNHPLLMNLSHIPDGHEYVVVDDLQKDDSDNFTEDQVAVVVSNSSSSAAGKTGKKFTEIRSAAPFVRIPEGSMIKCKVTRQSRGLFPEFTVINEADNVAFMAARKRKKNRQSTYLISSDPKHLSKQGSHYLAKLKEDASGTGFVIQDARKYNQDSPKKGLKQIAAVMYNKQTVPHDIKIAVRPLSNPDNSETDFTESILNDLNNEDEKKVQIYRSKRPRRTADGRSYGLNFHGRVTMASIKNFQIIDGDRLVMQFGRIGENSFSLDAYAPLTPVEAFSVALTIFEAYDTVI